MKKFCSFVVWLWLHLPSIVQYMSCSGNISILFKWKIQQKYRTFSIVFIWEITEMFDSLLLILFFLLHFLFHFFYSLKTLFDCVLFYFSLYWMHSVWMCDEPSSFFVRYCIRGAGIRQCVQCELHVCIPSTLCNTQMYLKMYAMHINPTYVCTRSSFCLYFCTVFTFFLFCKIFVQNFSIFHFSLSRVKEKIEWISYECTKVRITFIVVLLLVIVPSPGFSIRNSIQNRVLFYLWAGTHKKTTHTHHENKAGESDREIHL